MADDELTLEVEEQAEQSSASDATALLSLEELIKNHIDGLDRLREELRKNREMFDDAFNNDPLYREQLEKVKEVNKQKAATRTQILRQPSIIALQAKIKDLRVDLKERQLALSDYLREYQRLTGANEIQGNDGEVRDIVNTAKVVRKNKR